jgi:hypothetical protein
LVSKGKNPLFKPLPNIHKEIDFVHTGYFHFAGGVIFVAKITLSISSPKKNNGKVGE